MNVKDLICICILCRTKDLVLLLCINTVTYSNFIKFINNFVYFCYNMSIHKGVDDGLILLSTFPDEESLIELSKTLIKDKKLCACVNYTRINSLYMWKNDLKQENEFVALYKTTSKCVEQLKMEIL